MPKLGVNIDHVATLRQARKGVSPDPIQAALACEKAGADSIVAHLREDRRHIQDADIIQLRKIIKTSLNLEMSTSPDIINLAIKIKPHQVTLVPEKRRELTTEGGLNVVENFSKIKNTIRRLSEKKIPVSLFIDPHKKQILAAKKTGACSIEIHTGTYANAKTLLAKQSELKKIKNAAQLASEIGLIVHAGHGLNYTNIKKISEIHSISEFNIGHSIIAQATFTGLEKAVKDMLRLIQSS